MIEIVLKSLSENLFFLDPHFLSNPSSLQLQSCLIRSITFGPYLRGKKKVVYERRKDTVITVFQFFHFTEDLQSKCLHGTLDKLRQR